MNAARQVAFTARSRWPVRKHQPDRYLIRYRAPVAARCATQSPDSISSPSSAGSAS